MRIRLTYLLALVLLLILATTVHPQDANTTATTTVACCSLSITGELTTVDNGSGIILATVRLKWTDASGATVRTEDINITDGSPDTVADDFLTGTGTGGTPLGYIRAVGEAASGESGSVSKRWKYRRLFWLKANARLSNNAVTLQ